jgi:hypothetical protein
MIKIPFVFYGQLTCLLCEKLLESFVFCGWLVKVAFFVGQISNLRIAFILGRKEYGQHSHANANWKRTNRLYVSRMRHRSTILVGWCLAKKSASSENSMLATAILTRGRRKDFSMGNCQANNMCYFEKNKV